MEPSARTLGILMSWEEKYGLDVIRQHLDDGLFSRDPVEQRLCYHWLEQRRRARRNNRMVEVGAGVAVLLGLTGYLVWSD